MRLRIRCGLFFALLDIMHRLGWRDPVLGIHVVHRRLHSNRVVLGE